MIEHVDLELHEAEVVALLGASAPQEHAAARARRLDPGAEASSRRRPSAPSSSRTTACCPGAGLAQRDHRLRGRTRDDASGALDEVGIAARADAWPATLSGGESQRVALARAVQRPRGLRVRQGQAAGVAEARRRELGEARRVRQRPARHPGPRRRQRRHHHRRRHAAAHREVAGRARQGDPAEPRRHQRLAHRAQGGPRPSTTSPASASRASRRPSRTATCRGCWTTRG